MSAGAHIRLCELHDETSKVMQASDYLHTITHKLCAPLVGLTGLHPSRHGRPLVYNVCNRHIGSRDVVAVSGRTMTWPECVRTRALTPDSSCLAAHSSRTLASALDTVAYRTMCQQGREYSHRPCSPAARAAVQTPPPLALSTRPRPATHCHHVSRAPTSHSAIVTSLSRVPACFHSSCCLIGPGPRTTTQHDE